MKGVMEKDKKEKTYTRTDTPRYPHRHSQLMHGLERKTDIQTDTWLANHLSTLSLSLSRGTVPAWSQCSAFLQWLPQCTRTHSDARFPTLSHEMHMKYIHTDLNAEMKVKSIIHKRPSISRRLPRYINHFCSFMRQFPYFKFTTSNHGISLYITSTSHLSFTEPFYI